MPAAVITSAPALLEAKGLAGQRGERRLFDGLELTLHAGNVVWLRGRNGRGKTTLLRILAGLSPAAMGTLRLNGEVWRGASGSPTQRRPLYVAHANALKDDLTAVEALRFLCALAGTAPSQQATTQALKRLGMASRADAPVRTLSQGQRRRVALARLAMAPEGGVWLLDEPYDALDPKGILALNEVLASHTARGGAVLMTSHQAVSLERPSPRIVDLDAYAPKPG